MPHVDPRELEELRKTLADPAVSLRAYGTVADQSEAGSLVRYDPTRITVDLQNTILSYVSDPPVDQDGYTKWLTLLGYRQSGKSLTSILAFYCKAAYSAAWDHVTYADTDDRAKYLHSRAMLNHDNWPDEIRSEQRSTDEVLKLSFTHGGGMRVRSARTGAAGIGQSVASLLASEVAFWLDAETTLSLIYPSMRNRRNVLMIRECTPADDEAPSATYWSEECDEARKGEGRHIYAFFPFWDGLLNRRAWPKNAALDAEELKLLEEYGPRGLTLENLAFRRSTFADDRKIRNNHALFGVYYPFDDVSCWLVSGSGTIPVDALERHQAKLVTEKYDEVVRFKSPHPAAQYLICVDPSGYGVDHAAFHVLEIWDDEWEQVASFSGVISPDAFVKLLVTVGLEYNTARIAAERNGVGAGTLAGLKLLSYPNIHHDKWQKPGVWKASHDEMMEMLVDALRERFTLHGDDTVRQLRKYRGDKATERSVRAQLLTPDDRTGKRRKKHHWDRVSALMIGAVAARSMPTRYKPAPEPEQNVVLFRDMTWDDLRRYENQRKAMAAKEAGSGRRAKYKSRRRRG